MGAATWPPTYPWPFFPPRRVMISSAWDGSATPLGWLCARMTAAALCFEASLTTSLGYTEAPSMVPRKRATQSLDGENGVAK